MQQSLTNKYIEKLRAAAPNSNPCAPTPKGADNQRQHGENDTKTILSENSRVFAIFTSMRYKKAKLCKAKSGWYVWFEFKNPETGLFEKHIRRCGINRIKHVNERKREAAALVDAINQLLADGWVPDGIQSDRVNDLDDKNLIQCIEYLLKLKKSLAKNTHDHYKGTVKVFTEFLEAKNLKFMLPQMFKVVDAVAFGDFMLLTKGYSGKTYNGHRSNLKTFFNEMNDRLQIWEKNPVTRMRKQPETQTGHKPFTPEQRKTLKDHFSNYHPRLGKFVQFIYYCGLRPQEILRIRMEDIKLEQKSIIIYGSSAKNRKQQPVTLPPAMVEVILGMNIEKYPPTWFLFSHRLESGPRELLRNKVSKLHRKHLKMAGIGKEHTLYSWKHTGAVESFMLHHDPYKIMKQLRHSSLEMTMKYLRSLGLDVNFTYEIPTF